jgi:putative Mg2+ transporter-C (MgtC) family protein
MSIHLVDPLSLGEHVLMSGIGVRRLLMACAMGGAVGIEREWRHKDSGLRTNMLICMGSALFTIMSIELAGISTPNKGQVAANIVQGIGFLGAGLILHTKNRILGLTSAATVFVVAAIGMTCGAGLYLEAFAATAIVLLSLRFVGTAEVRIGWHRYPMIYEVRANLGAALPAEIVGEDRATALAQAAIVSLYRMQSAILKVLDEAGQRMSVLERDNVAGLERIAFTVTTTRRTHDRVLRGLRANDATDEVVVFRDAEEE